MKKKCLQHLIMLTKYSLYGFFLQCLLVSTLFATDGNAQIPDAKEIFMDLNVKEERIGEVLGMIEKQTQFSFVYTSKELDTSKRVSINVKNASVSDILKELSRQANIKFRQVNKNISIQKIDAKEEGLGYIKASLAPVAVTGKVIDQLTGEGLPGVTVVVQETNNGTITDIEGRYSISIEKEGTLIFSFVGYHTQEVPVEGRRIIDIALEEDVKALEEVVVVGYGTQKKVNLTGAVSSISSEEITNVPVGQSSLALQGVAPGITVIQRSGQPGRDAGTIRIRGLGTLGDNSPLVMVDGVETSLDNVDPNEIESISVLKDAASSAIYGARAANGVVLVTTKRGVKGVRVNYNGYAGFQTPTDMPNIVNAVDHMEMTNIAYENVNLTPIWSEEAIAEHRNGMPSDQYPNTDWQALTMKDRAFMQNHSIGINAGGESAKLYASFSYLDQDGIIPNTDFQRYNVRVNSDINVTEKLTASMDVFLSRTEMKEPANGTGYVFHWMRRIPANEVGILSNGRYGEGWNGDHPLARAQDGGLGTVESLNAILNFRLNYQFTDWLSAEVMYAPRFENPHERRFFNITQTYANDGVTPTHFVPQRNSLTERFEREWYNNTRAVVTMDKTLNNIHHLNFLVGFQQEDQTNQWTTAYREVFPLPDYQQIDAGNRENERTGGSATHWALRSFFGRAKYNFRDRYLFEANVRRDGSSRFAEGNRHGIFPSFSAAWRISEEPFMEGLRETVQQLKIRASWGQLGNQNIGLYPFAAFVQIGGGSADYVFGNSIAPGAALNSMANPNIVWETSETTDIGLEANLWGKLDISFDYYYRLTHDILLPLNIPQTLGLSAPYQNAGEVENKGWEFATTYRDRVGAVNYGITFNLSDVRNQILDMRGIQQTGLQVNREGHPISSFLGYEAIGLFQSEEEVKSHATQFGTIAPGDIKYRDVNNDGLINQEDLMVVGSPIPRYTFGARFNVDYKGIDLSLFLQGVGKADGYLFGQGIMPFYVGGTVQEQHKDYWTPDNPNASFPRLAFNQVNNEQNSSYWMRSAAYLRGQNLQIGYTFPESLLKKVQRMRVYVSGRNLFTIDRFYEGYDPEAPVSSGGWYPQMTVYTFGINASF